MGMPKTSNHSKRITFKSQLQAIIDKWQHLLKLDDWTIEIEVNNAAAMEQHALAFVEDESSIKYAKITFANKNAFKSDKSRTIEQVLTYSHG